MQILFDFLLLNCFIQNGFVCVLVLIELISSNLPQPLDTCIRLGILSTSRNWPRGVITLHVKKLFNAAGAIFCFACAPDIFSGSFHKLISFFFAGKFPQANITLTYAIEAN